jgi:hypothetical protein
MSSDGVIDGASLAKCIKLVDDLGKEINALNDTLREMLLDRIKDDSWCIEAKIDVDRYTDSGWLCSDWAVSFPLKEPRKKEATRYFGYQISLIGDGMSVPGNNEPMLHVFLWGVAAGFKDDQYSFSFPLENDSDEPWCLRNGVLIDWCCGEDAKSWAEQQWTFTLPLVALNSREHLEERIINLSMELLRAKGAEAYRKALQSVTEKLDPYCVHYEVSKSELVRQSPGA